MASVASDDAELARQLEDVREQQRAISGVLRAVARSAGIQPVLDEVVEACERLCRADYGALYLLEHGLLHVAAHNTQAAGAEYDRQHPHALDRTTGAGRAAVAREPVHIPDIREDPGYSYGGPTEYYRSLIAVPVMVEDDLIGVVVLVRREPKPFTEEHIALVQSFADQAAIAVANARLMEAVERQRTELARFVSPQVAELISSREGERLLAGHRAYISCLFCDLRGFTAFAETAAPEELFDVLREYHAAVGDLIPAHEGTLEHFAGDGLLAEAWRGRGTVLGLGIGVEAGYATIGRIGFEGRYDYGVLGPVANLASRLSTQAAAGQILIGQRLFAAVEEGVETAPAGNLELKASLVPSPRTRFAGCARAAGRPLVSASYARSSAAATGTRVRTGTA
jgi:adenylate cyclase